MPVSVGATTYRFRGRAKKGKSVKATYFDTLDLMYAERAAKNDGLTINDPFYAQEMVDAASNPPPGAIENEGDIVNLQKKVAKYVGQLENIERIKSKENINKFIDIDLKEARYSVIARHADDPLAYLGGITKSYMFAFDIGQATIQQLEEANRLGEATSLQKKLLDVSDEVKLFSEIDLLYDDNGNPYPETQDQLKNYAVVYRTDGNGKILDMGIRRATGLTIEAGSADDIGQGVVTLTDKNYNPILMRGMLVASNIQNESGMSVAKLGDRTAMVGKTEEIEKKYPEEIPGFVRQPSTVGIIPEESPDFNDIGFRGLLRIVDPLEVTELGRFARFSDGRTFRFNREMKWDEISPKALKYFGDYNERDALKVDSVNAGNLLYRSGKVIKEEDLIPMTYRVGEPTRTPEWDWAAPERTTPSLTPRASFIGGQQPVAPVGASQFMTPAEPRISRPVGVERYSGQEQFDIKTGKLFSGQPSP